MSLENFHDSPPPRTPVSLENPSNWVLSPNKVQRAHEDRASDECQLYLDNEQERDISRDSNYPRSIVFTSSPIMMIPQEKSIADTSHHLNKSRSTRCSKRRSRSLDESIPIPRILLRPRLTKKYQEHFSSCTRTRQRGQLFLSHTFDESDNTNMSSSTSDRASSPPKSFTMSYSNQALPTRNCSMDSPLNTPGVARPIPRHFTPAGAQHNLTFTPLSSATTTYGAGIICSSFTSAFETTPSTIAKSKANSVRTPSPQSD